MSGQPTTRYHWILALSGSIAGQQATASFDGPVDLAPGSSRSQVYADLREQVLERIRRQTGATMANPCTVYFALEPEQL